MWTETLSDARKLGKELSEGEILSAKEFEADIKRTCSFTEQRIYALENKFELLRLEQEYVRRELNIGVN